MIILNTPTFSTEFQKGVCLLYNCMDQLFNLLFHFGWIFPISLIFLIRVCICFLFLMLYFVLHLILLFTILQQNWYSELDSTAPLLREWIYREWNIIYKDRAVLNILHRLGFSHTRPTYTLEKADEQKQQVFRETFETYKKTRKWGN